MSYRTLVVAIVGIAVVIVLGYLFRPQPVAVDLALVERAPMRVTIDEEGETRVRDVYVVSSPLPGRIDRIEVRAGDAVTAGITVLATLQESEPTFLDVRSRRRAEAALAAAEAAHSLASAERKRVLAELDYARAEWDRATALAERGTISQATLDRARLELSSREAALASADAAQAMRQSELDIARAELIDPAAGGFDQPAGGGCCVPVMAPVDGHVLRVLRESEGVVASGEPLVEIGDPHNLEIVADLLSADAVTVAEGAEVLIEGWGGDAALAGRVRRVEPYGFTKVSALGIEEQRVNVVMDIVAPAEAWRALGHGFRVETRIVTWAAESVLRVPAGALFRQGDSWAVFVAGEGRALSRQVELGHFDDHGAEVLSGIAEGEHVVLHPSDRLSDGTRISEWPHG
ncbi:MAG: HlyD family efflux transporter periplasmic adaptor subunit [Alphaproteobacteria bacterium]|jgi:HlyD family secretion protein|nr:HlyD family efflux transporter periplasmic adaptor subunit [Alphaproteobacteria bacterium]